MLTAQPRVNHYEAMFVLSQSVAADFGGAIAHIRELLDKGGATIVAMKKWDDRRFAFEIDKQKRGVYILVYFACHASKLGAIERASNLSEKILRQLIIRADHLTVDEMKSADGQKELEIEAKLRASQPQVATDEPVTVAAAADEDDAE